MLRRLAKKLLPPPKHPIDRAMGIETSGTVSPHRLRTGNLVLDNANVGYVGSQPSVITHALASLGDAVKDVEFMDLGCGKGRVLAVAGRFPFARLTGIELSPPLARTAERNLARLLTGGAAPQGSRIIEGDATRPPLSPGAVLYLYNSFGESLVRQLVEHIEAQLGRTPIKLWFVYYNPVHASVFDGSAMFERYLAERVPFSAEETKAHTFSNTADSIVVWQSRADPMQPPHAGANRPVHITIPNLGAEVEMG